MQKQQNKKLVPKLRFKEFEGEWEFTTLKSISKGGKYGLNASAKDFDGTNKYIRITDIDENSNKFIPSPLTSPSGELSDEYLLSEGDLLFARTGASTGKSYLYDSEDGKLYYAGFLIKFSISTANPYFVFSQTQRGEFNRWVQVMSMRSGQPGINAEEYGALKIAITSKEEQQKIASFLTAVDKRIEQLTKKKKLLEEYKKGVMQKIFSQEIRFKDENGNDFPEWEEKKLGEIGDTYTGLNGKSAGDFGKGLPFITYMQVFSSSEIDITGFRMVCINDGENQNKVKFGDVLFTTSSETPNEVGYASVMLSEVDDVYLNSFCFGYRIRNHNELTPHFAQYLFRSQPFRKLMYKLAQGSTRYNLSKIEMLKHLVYIPFSIAEQEKIYGFVKCLDIQIMMSVNSIEIYINFKKGLLQQMFI